MHWHWHWHWHRYGHGRPFRGRAPGKFLIVTVHKNRLYRTNLTIFNIITIEMVMSIIRFDFSQFIDAYLILYHEHCLYRNKIQLKSFCLGNKIFLKFFAEKNLDIFKMLVCITMYVNNRICFFSIH